MPAAKPTTDTPPACEDCRFWDEAQPKAGYCKALPPQLISVTSPMGHWPMTVALAWCGKFLPRKRPEPKGDKPVVL